jgi:hypothetical protein
LRYSKPPPGSVERTHGDPETSLKTRGDRGPDAASTRPRLSSTSRLVPSGRKPCPIEAMRSMLSVPRTSPWRAPSTTTGELISTTGIDARLQPTRTRPDAARLRSAAARDSDT